MGASDGFILPLQAQYVKEAIASGRSAKKIGWIGAPAHYPPSRAVAEVVPDAEQHFFDPIASDTATTHMLDANVPGWGAEIASQGFDMLTLFRVTCHIVDPQGLIDEIKAFIGDDEKRTVIFEDLLGREKYGSDPLLYKTGDTQFYAPQNHVPWGEELLSQSFTVSRVVGLSYADKDITGVYYTLTRKP